MGEKRVKREDRENVAVRVVVIVAEEGKTFEHRQRKHDRSHERFHAFTHDGIGEKIPVRTIGCQVVPQVGANGAVLEQTDLLPLRRGAACQSLHDIAVEACSRRQKLPAIEGIDTVTQIQFSLDLVTFSRFAQSCPAFDYIRAF
jgi:hypothetical protein